MALNGDNITLWAAAEPFSVDIAILSSLGPNANTVISPSSGASFAEIHLGHLAKGEREHYLCLQATSQEVETKRQRRNTNRDSDSQSGKSDPGPDKSEPENTKEVYSFEKTSNVKEFHDKAVFYYPLNE